MMVDDGRRTDYEEWKWPFRRVKLTIEALGIASIDAEHNMAAGPKPNSPALWRIAGRFLPEAHWPTAVGWENATNISKCT